MTPRNTFAVLLALTFVSGAVTAQEPAKAKTPAAVPAKESAKNACSSSTGETKAECEKVAAQIDAQKVNPDAKTKAYADRPPSQDVQHSGPAMVTPEEQKQIEKTKKENRKDAAQAPNKE